jgi:hypothetical protein
MKPVPAFDLKQFIQGPPSAGGRSMDGSLEESVGIEALYLASFERGTSVPAEMGLAVIYER